MNAVSLIGRLVADPELRKTSNDISTTTFRIAVNRAYVKKGEERQADFITILAWRGTADFICKWFKKGQMIALTGSIQTRQYEDREGNKRTSFEVVADNVEFAGSNNESKQKSVAPAQSNNDFEIVDESLDMDLPF